MRGSAALRASVAPGGALAGPWVQNSLWTSARAVPSLDLRFADNKSLTDAVTGASLVTFTRASSGTFVGSDGVVQTAATDVPRFDHNPTTGESLGLLVEEARTNLLLRSEKFDDASWTKSNLTVTADDAISPDGTIDADKIVSNSGSLGFIVQSGSQTTGTSYTWSVFAKAGEYSFCQLRITGTVVPSITRAYFNLATGTITGIANCTASITPAGDGWYRCLITYTTTSTATAAPRFYGQVDAADTVGDGTSGIYLWGAQLEAGAFPTSYIPTTTAAATRSADVASISGSNFSSWYRQDEGASIADAAVMSVANTPAIISFSDGTDTGNLIQVNTSSAGVVRYRVAVGGVAQVNNLSSGFTTAINTSFKCSAAYKASDFAISVNGGNVVTQASGTLPAPTQLRLFQTGSGGSIFSGTIRRLTFWPTRLPNSTLQGITQ